MQEDPLAVCFSTCFAPLSENSFSKLTSANLVDVILLYIKQDKFLQNNQQKYLFLSKDGFPKMHSSSSVESFNQFKCILAKHK